MSAKQVFREWFMLEACRDDPQTLVTRLSAAGFEAFSPKLGRTRDSLFPGHLFVAADPETDDGALRGCAVEIRFVTNECNRPMPIPGDVARALRDPETDEGQALTGWLGVIAPEYRIDSLCRRVVRRH